MRIRRLLLVPLAAALALVATTSGPASATHAWGSYHWARTANPFTVKLGDNLSSTWTSYLADASTDWSKSTVLDTTVVAGRTGGRCRPTSGRVEVCNSTYGNNGWLGVASIWASGSHITQGTVKLNDSYFNTAAYNTSAWRHLVTCQEVGHTFGLAHQDENFNNANLGTCMDYTNDPSTNQHPNAHDYDELALIYAHLDSTTTVGAAAPGASAAGSGNSEAEWGRAVGTSADGRPDLFVRELGNDQQVFTFVVWAG
ncbi:MAG TPA: hypothetical protein VFJ85_07035 [Acidimicrobiales bacterium]|nr:hypothetical protein [Acidimicrobiales bacterium]